MESKIGLKTLSERLQNLEKINDVESLPDDFAGRMIKSKKKKDFDKDIKTKDELDRVKKHYYDNLIEQVPDPNFLNLSKVVEYTVKYVEKNAGKISEIIDMVVDGEFKLETAIMLITDLITDVDIDFLKNLVSEMVYLLFNQDREKKKKIKRKKSISKKTQNGLFGFCRK